MRIRILLTLLVFAILLGVGTPTALAAPCRVCASRANGNWSNQSMWSCDDWPKSSDIVIIDYKHTVTLDFPGSAYQLIVGTGAGGTLTQEATPRTLEVGVGGVSVNPMGTLNSPSNLFVNGNMTVNGTFNGGSANVNIKGDLNISDSGTFNAPSRWMTIDSGNLTNNSIFNHNGGGILMAGSSARIINGNFTFNHLTIANSAGVDLISNATVNSALALNYDLRVASGAVLTMGSDATTSGDADVVGRVKRTSFSAGTPYTFGSPYTTITFGSSGTLPSEVVVELSKTAPGGLTNAVQRYYSITPTGGSDYTFNLRLHYLDSELSGIDENNLQIWQQVNGRWTLRPVTSRDTTNNWVETTGLTSFSLWAISNSGAPTAVNLSTFDARADAPNALPFVGLGALALLALGAGMWWRRK